MTDITTTAPVTTGFEGLQLARPAVIGELARVEASTRAAIARAVELEAAIAAESVEEISDGAHPRLLEFWAQAGEIADDHDMCKEYDRMVEAVHGVTREREWDVDMTVEVRLRVTRTVEAVTEEQAIDAAEEGLSIEDLVEYIRENGWDDIEFIESEAS